MRHRYIRGAALGVAAALTVLLAAPLVVPGAQTSASAEPMADDTPDTLLDRIVDAGEVDEDSPEELAEVSGLPLEGPGSLVFDDEERIVMMVRFAGAPSASILEEIGALGEVEAVQEAFRTATVNIDPSNLAELLEIGGVVDATPGLMPISGSAGSLSTGVTATASATAATATAASTLSANLAAAIPGISRTDHVSTPAPCNSLLIEADVPLRADEARSTYGVDGSGVRIGIISDSYNVSSTALTDAEDDVLSGALPGAGNPCGRTTPVNVLVDAATGSDEGRAMAQLVHGIAPGAELLFARAGSHEGEFAQAIFDLAAAGADIIVDDISMGTEPFYQQGFVSGAINQVREQNVAYFSSTGNSTAVATEGPGTGMPLSSWQTGEYRAMECPTWVDVDDPDEVYDCLDFNPDASISTAYDTLNIDDEADESRLMVAGSIGEPIYGTTTDYEWQFYQADPGGGDPTKIGNSLPRVSPALPNVFGSVTVQPGTEVYMVMVRKDFDDSVSATPAVNILFVRGAGAITSRTHMGDNRSDIVGLSVFGHGGDGSATSVGSVNWQRTGTDSFELREYSSFGPALLFFEPASLTEAVPSARLESRVLAHTPHVMAVDGTQTTFFGGEDDDGAHRFFGTSAAAPHAAAVAALARSYAPELTQEELTQHVVEAANPDVENLYQWPFVDSWVRGAGVVDAMATIDRLPDREIIPTMFSVSSQNELQFEWTANAPTRFVITLYRGEALPENAVESSQLAAETREYTFSGLEPDTLYTVQLTPYGAYGVVGETETQEVRTLAVDGGGDSGGSGASGDANGSNGSLSRTGSEDATPLVLAATALVLLGVGAAAFGLMRRRRGSDLTQ